MSSASSSYHFKADSFRIPAPEERDLPGQAILDACEPALLPVTRAGLSAIAYAGSSNRDLLRVPILDDLGQSAIHPDFAAVANRVPEKAYMAKSGAAIVAIARAVQDFARDHETIFTTCNRTGDISDRALGADCTATRSFAEHVTAEAAGRHLLPSGLSVYGLAATYTMPRSEGLGLAAILRPDPLYRQRAHFIDIQAGHHTWDGRYPPEATASISIGRIYGPFGGVESGVVGFHRLPPFAAVLTALCLGEGKVLTMSVQDADIFHPNDGVDLHF